MRKEELCAACPVSQNQDQDSTDPPSAEEGAFPPFHLVAPPPSLKDTSVLVVLYSESPIVPKNAVLGLLELYCPWAPRLVAHLREGAAVICANVVCEGRRS